MTTTQRIPSTGERPSLYEECRDLRFKLREANRRLAELNQLTPVLFADMDEAFQQECERRGTTPAEIRRTIRLKTTKSVRYAVIRAVGKRFPDATVQDLARYFGCDRHLIYWSMKEDAE